MAGTFSYSAAGSPWGVPKTRLDRMLFDNWNDGISVGIIRFKYYGEFDTMKRIYDDCKDDLKYIGNSNLDGSPIFVYEYKEIERDTVKDFKELNLLLRKIKLKHYAKQELTKEERSLRSFFKFFMIAHDNYEIKGVSNSEINTVSYIEP
jgi:hypothetical protein